MIPSPIRLRVGRFGLDYDRDYGMLKRSGWTAVYDGSVQAPEFVGFFQALQALLRAAARARAPSS